MGSPLVHYRCIWISSLCPDQSKARIWYAREVPLSCPKLQRFGWHQGEAASAGAKLRFRPLTPSWSGHPLSCEWPGAQHSNPDPWLTAVDQFFLRLQPLFVSVLWLLLATTKGTLGIVVFPFWTSGPRVLWTDKGHTAQKLEPLSTSLFFCTAATMYF